MIIRNITKRLFFVSLLLFTAILILVTFLCKEIWNEHFFGKAKNLYHEDWTPRTGFNVVLYSLKEKLRSLDSYPACHNYITNHFLDIVGKTNYFDENIEIKKYITKICTHWKKEPCVLHLAGQVYVDKSPISLEKLSYHEELKRVQKAGWWQPYYCGERNNVAIIIPYRNRKSHLAQFLRHMHPLLQRQDLHYRIFVVDQIDDSPFNRGKLMNVGFNEALKYFPYDCFVFHDVDLLPEDDRNLFDCSSSPQHMCPALDKFEYKLIYQELFGGVEMFTREHFQLVNGFSNSFWGWGAEDDNLYRRLAWKQLLLSRPPMFIGRYQMLKHVDQELNADPKRFDIRAESYKHFATDGLNTLHYLVNMSTFHPLFTHIKVDLQKYKQKMFGVKEALT